MSTIRKLLTNEHRESYLVVRTANVDLSRFSDACNSIQRSLVMGPYVWVLKNQLGGCIRTQATLGFNMAI